jgi:hypothetical protein
MKSKYELEGWATDLTLEHFRYSTPSSHLWKSLKTGFTSHVDAANEAFELKRLSVIRSDDDAIVIGFGRFELRLTIDMRIAQMSYLVADTQVTTFDPKASEILERGEFVLQQNHIMQNPVIMGTKSFAQIANWPVPEQMIEYLVQRLVVPSFVDDRLI